MEEGTQRGKAETVMPLPPGTGGGASGPSLVVLPAGKSRTQRASWDPNRSWGARWRSMNSRRESPQREARARFPHPGGGGRSAQGARRAGPRRPPVSSHHKSRRLRPKSSAHAT